MVTAILTFNDKMAASCWDTDLPFLVSRFGSLLLEFPAHTTHRVPVYTNSQCGRHRTTYPLPQYTTGFYPPPDPLPPRNNKPHVLSTRFNPRWAWHKLLRSMWRLSISLFTQTAPVISKRWQETLPQFAASVLRSGRREHSNTCEVGSFPRDDDFDYVLLSLSAMCIG
jgi:hypothetical protein